MKRIYVRGLAVCILLGLFFSQPVLLRSAGSAATPDRTELSARVQHAAVPFVANQGQTDKKVKFHAATLGGAVFVTNKGEIVYSLHGPGEGRPAEGAVIMEKLLHAKTRFVTGQERSTATVNYFQGNDRAKWKKDLPTYDVLNLGEPYPGVDLKLRAYGNNVEKLFYVGPEADPAAIAIGVEGAQCLTINKRGELEVKTGSGKVTFTKPVAFQEVGGKRIEVPVAYRLSENSASRIPHSALVYGFSLGAYDRTKELVIDPLLASTYIGGTDLEGSALNPAFAMSIAIAPNGDVYIAGFTDSVNFPTVFGPFQSVSGGARDAFVSRFEPGLGNLVASTYLGGSGTDAATSLAVDSAGNVYVAGFTNSANFPTVAPYQAAKAGGTDAFAAKLDAGLSHLLASTYLGGAGDDHAFALVLDPSGVYVAGDTFSTNFPATAGSLQTSNADPSGTTGDGFIAKLGFNLQTLTAATYFGGTSNDVINALAVRGTNIYAAGDTASTNLTMVNPVQPANGGGTDAFVAEIANTLAAGGLLASTYLGGSGDEHAYSLALSPAGNVFVAGETSSPGLATAGAYQTVKSAGVDAFAAKLGTNLAGLTLTYLGGSGDDHAYSLTVNGANIYLAGDTTSPDFPATNGAYKTTSGGSDVFLAKMDDTLTGLSAATYFGGTGDDYANAVALDIFGNVYVAGFTFSTNLPTSATAYQTTNVGAGLLTSDAFVSEFDANLSTLAAAPDTTAPTAPTNLTAAAASDTEVSLVWTASTDNVGVAGYEVFRGSVKIATVTAAATTYRDTGLTASTAYSYKVRARDAANNVSAFSNQASATTLAAGTSDTIPPAPPANLTAEAGSDTQINLTWTAATDNVGVSGYEVWRGDAKIATITTTFFGDSGLTANTTYTYTVKAFDGADNISAASNPATATTRAATTPAGSGGSGGGGGGGCFIATAAYGSYMADDVMVLRRFRDDYLLTNATGRAFVKLYYTYSPPLAAFIAEHETLRTATRAALSPLVYGVKYPKAAALMFLLLCTGGSAAVIRRKISRG